MKRAIAFSIFLWLLFAAGPVWAETYTVKKGDTFSEIAFKNGLSVEQLTAANPGVDPLLILIGDVLILPPSDEASYNAFLQELYSGYVQNIAIECFPLPSEAVSCLAQVTNPGQKIVSNITIKIDLTDAAGRIVTMEAGTPMSQLLPGEVLPVLFHFSDAVTPPFTTAFTILDFDVYDDTVNSFRIPDTAWRYDSTISADGLRAAIQVWFTDSPEAALFEKEINLFAAAYDADGRPVGVRSRHGDAQSAFDLNLYSLSGPISAVNVWAEGF